MWRFPRVFSAQPVRLLRYRLALTARLAPALLTGHTICRSCSARIKTWDWCDCCRLPTCDVCLSFVREGYLYSFDLETQTSYAGIAHACCAVCLFTGLYTAIGWRDTPPPPPSPYILARSWENLINRIILRSFTIQQLFDPLAFEWRVWYYHIRTNLRIPLSVRVLPRLYATKSEEVIQWKSSAAARPWSSAAPPMGQVGDVQSHTAEIEASYAVARATQPAAIARLRTQQLPGSSHPARMAHIVAMERSDADQQLP